MEHVLLRTVLDQAVEEHDDAQLKRDENLLNQLANVIQVGVSRAL